MLRTKFKYENKQGAITQKLSKRELWFLCTALRLDEIYPPMKFHNRSKHSLGDKGNNSKLRQVRVKVPLQCTPP